MNDSMMPDSSSSDFSSKVVADQVAEDLASPLNTAFSEVFLSQLGSDSAHSFLDFDFPSETIPDTYQTENTGTHQDLYFSFSVLDRSIYGYSSQYQFFLLQWD